MTTALQSLYGAKVLAGNVGGQDRNPVALTPDWILEAVRSALGGRIVYDPCASHRPQDWVADHNQVLTPDVVELQGLYHAKPADMDQKTRAAIKKFLLAQYAGGSCLDTWTAPTFCNPPYDPLRPWMVAGQRAGLSGTPVVMLIPVRPQRKWWFPLCFGGEIVYLYHGVTFKGWSQAVPFPVCLVSFNCTVPPLGARETYRDRPVQRAA